MTERVQPKHEIEQAFDDFKLVDGIGPAVEKRLHAAGIRTYTQLAHLKPEMADRYLDGMVGYSPKRIKEQDWSGQARVLAGRAKQHIAEEALERANNSLHYASYTIELLLDRENQVRRTRTMHVQTLQEATWAGWDIDRLGNFMVDKGQLQISLGNEIVIEKEAPVASQKLTTEMIKPTEALHGNINIVETRLMSQVGQPLGIFIPVNTPFVVQLMLDLSKVEIPKGELLSYETIIYMKKFGANGRDVTGGKEGTLSGATSAVIDVISQPLAQGEYRLEALVVLRPQSQPNSLKTQLTAFTEGMLLHVS